MSTHVQPVQPEPYLGGMLTMCLGFEPFSLSYCGDFSNLPVHIDDCHRERKTLLLELIHEVDVLHIRVGIYQGQPMDTSQPKHDNIRKRDHQFPNAHRGMIGECPDREKKALSDAR